MEWVECNEDEVEWSEMEMRMRWRWSEMANEMEWRWKEKERRFFFLENIECQVSLIFTLHFLYKTANLWLVFRLIRFFFIFIFYWKKQRLGWWGRRILLHQPYCRILLEHFDKFLFWEWLMINFQSMAIHNERSLKFINSLDSYRSIVKDFVNLIWPKPMSLKFSFEVFKLGIKQ